MTESKLKAFIKPIRSSLHKRILISYIRSECFSELFLEWGAREEWDGGMKGGFESRDE